MSNLLLKKLDKIQQTFSISDLVHLTGINAHSIRKWEARYSLLEPGRTGTNIRRYSADALKRLMNIAVLLDKGYKISEVASMSEEDIVTAIEQSETVIDEYGFELSRFRISMLTFDSGLFQSTFADLRRRVSFAEIFHKVMIPLLEDTGRLWQTGVVTPAQEHFLSNLIRQKLFFEIEKAESLKKKDSSFFVLFLPHNEFHEIGLLFIHFLLLSKGMKSIYLGQSVSPECLAPVKTGLKGSVTYISFLTVVPELKEQKQFIDEYKSMMKSNDRLWIVGRKAEALKNLTKGSSIKIFKTPDELMGKVITV